MLTNLFNWFLGITQGMGYLGVGLLMTIESSFFPLPSEIVVPPAAYLASQGSMNLVWIVIAGIVGSVLGAIINYLIGLYLGRIVIYRLAASSWAKFLLINPNKVERAEKYFLKNANSATFFGRLIPVIRQLVSLPAGFSKMHFGRFLLWTTLGSAIWVVILAALGYLVGANQDLLKKYYQEIYWVLLVLGVLWIAWKIIRIKKNKK